MFNLPEGTNIYHQLTPDGKPYVVYNATVARLCRQGHKYCIQYQRKKRKPFNCHFPTKEKRDHAFLLITKLTTNGTLKLTFDEFFHKELPEEDLVRTLSEFKGLTLHNLMSESISTAIRLGFTLEEILDRDPIRSIGVSKEDMTLMLAGAKPVNITEEDYPVLAHRLSKVFRSPRYVAGKGVSKDELFLYLLKYTTQ